jgi:hypothetical protein
VDAVGGRDDVQGGKRRTIAVTNSGGKADIDGELIPVERGDARRVTFAM